jgi:hypothetical protein
MLASVETKRVKILDLLENVQFQPIQRLAVFAPVAAPSAVVDPGRFPETFSLHAIQQTITRLPFVTHMPAFLKSTAASLPLSASYIQRQECLPCTTR